MLSKNNNKHQKLPILKLAALSLAFAFPLSAEQITFVGNVKTALPKVTLTHSNDPLAHVKPFTLSVSPSAGVCSIASSEDTAKRHGSSPICLITWNDPKGLDAYLRGLKGISSNAGAQTFTYTLSMFDKDKFDVISSDQYSVTFATPQIPDAPTLTSFWLIKSEDTGLTHNIYNRLEKNTRVAFSLTERNYDQKIEFGDFSCSIPEGQTECIITLNTDFTDKDVQGIENIPFRSADTYKHFEKEKTPYQYVWDFRPPVIQSVHVNSNDTRLPKVITDYPETLVLLHDQAAVVVKSPHTNIEDDWWLPTDPALSIAPSRSLNITDTLNINNINVKFNLSSTSQSSYRARPIAKPARMGEYLVYVYDFSDINDGLYNFQFSTMDKNGNGELQTLEDIYIDRLPPDIQFIVNERQHRGSVAARLFTLSDITVAAWGGWEDGSKIVSAKVNDENVDFAGGTDLVKRIANIDLPFGSMNKLEITALDKTGNEVVKILDFKFGEYEFDTYSTTVMAQVQPTEIFLDSIKGASCIGATSDELAQLYSETAKGLRRGCTIEWITSPAGVDTSELTTVATKRLRVGMGNIATPGTHEYAFNVHQHDAYGSSRVVYEARGQVEVMPLEAPELIVGLSHIAENFSEDYRYKLPQGRPLSIPVLVNHPKGSDITVELIDKQNNVIRSEDYNTYRGYTRTRFSTETQYQPLSDYGYRVRAYYKANPALYSEKPYNFYVTPSSMVRLTLTHPQVAVQGVNIPIIANIGLNTGTGLAYTPSLGEWEIYLTKFDSETKTYINVTEPALTDQDGKVALSLSADELLQADNRVYAFAKLKTTFPEIDMTLRATSLFKVPVLTTGNISVQLSSAQTSAPAPASFIVKLEYETTSDRLSAQDVTWQESPDGETWTNISQDQKLMSAYIHLPDAQERFVRASITHKLSNEALYTNVIKLTSFDEAVLTLYGDKRVLSGAVGKFNYDLNQYAVNNARGDVEWTLDDGLTWEPMSPSDEAVIVSSMDIKARLLISPADATPYYVYDAINVAHINPAILSALLSVSDRHAEVGDAITIKARFGPRDKETAEHHRFNYVLPTGEIVEDMTLSKVMAHADFSNGKATFLFRSWLDGQQLQTISTREVTINQIVYEFPATGVVVTTPDRVIKSNINLYLEKPLSSKLPKTVEINEEFILPPALELKRHAGNSATLVSQDPGLHSFTVRFFDNRGNQREHTAFVEVLDAEPMELFLDNRLEGAHLRPPIRLVSRMSAQFGSLGDRLSNVKWYLNDELQDESTIVTHRAVIEEPGDYTIKAHAVSFFGQEQEASYSFTIEPNKLPYCDPFWESRDKVITFNPNCLDDDGKVIRINITFDVSEEEERTYSRYSTQQISFIKDRYPTNRPLRVTVIDDSAEEISLTFPWPND